MRRRLAIAVLLAWLTQPLQSWPAHARTTLPAARPLPPIPPPFPSASAPAKPGPPPYEPELARLAELLGTLTFMRDLCAAGDGASWRDRMTALLDAEGSDAGTGERLAGSYNRGLRDYRLTYRTCTPAAQAVIARALAEGARISRDLSVRFGVD